jgi:integrase
MDTRTATLIIRYKAADGTWKRALAARGANGRIRPGHALIDGKQVQQREFQYQIRYYESRKLHYKSAGKRGAEAEALRDRIEKQRSVKAAAKSAGVKLHVEEERQTLSNSASVYIRDAEQRGAMEAASQARLVTTEFMHAVHKTYVDEITREDVFLFHKAIRKRGCQERTLANKHQRLISWLRFSKFDTSILPPKPRFEEQLPTIYSRDEISSLLANADERMLMLIRMGYLLGLRDQELQFAEFRDINRSENIFRVRSKPEWNFMPKSWEQRDIPLFEDLATELKDWQDKLPGQSLILGTSGGKHH